MTTICLQQPVWVSASTPLGSSATKHFPHPTALQQMNLPCPSPKPNLRINILHFSPVFLLKAIASGYVPFHPLCSPCYSQACCTSRCSRWLEEKEVKVYKAAGNGSQLCMNHCHPPPLAFQHSSLKKDMTKLFKVITQWTGEEIMSLNCSKTDLS